MNLYLNNSSIKNNKYFKNHGELLSLSNKELQEIKAYKKRTGFLKNANKKLVIIKNGDHSLSSKRNLDKITKELNNIISNYI